MFTHQSVTASETRLVKSMKNDMRLRGLSPRTQDSYLSGVYKITKYFGKEPDQLSEKELKSYILYLMDEKHYASETVRLMINGVKDLFRHTLKRKSEVLEGFKTPRKSKLPVVLTVDEMKSLLSCFTTYHSYVFFVLVYSCGLRISEALNIQIQDIEGKGQQYKRLKIRSGKGNKDRYVPLPETTYQLLRSYWALHRNPRLIFPALGHSHTKMSQAIVPISAATLHHGLKKAKKRAGLTKDGICVHTFRHSYATHLLEDGVDIRKVQEYLGHRNLQSTSIYLHLTSIGNDEAFKRINQLMSNFTRNHQEAHHE